MGLNCAIATRDTDIHKAFAIREAVFCDEQGYIPEDEFDEFENSSEHIVLYKDDNPVGCARLRKLESGAKLERIAVLKDHRGHGYGEFIVQFLLNEVKHWDVDEVYLNAQYHLQNFYSKFGFKPRGEEFYEGHVKHIQMVL